MLLFVLFPPHVFACFVIVFVCVVGLCLFLWFVVVFLLFSFLISVVDCFFPRLVFVCVVFLFVLCL